MRHGWGEIKFSKEYFRVINAVTHKFFKERYKRNIKKLWYEFSQTKRKYDLFFFFRNF